MRRLLAMCLNWKAAAILAAVGLVVWVLAPNLLIAALPLLLVALCPLSMAIMAWSMRGPMEGHEQTTAEADPAVRLAALEREQARVNRDIVALRQQSRAPVAKPQEEASQVDR